MEVLAMHYVHGWTVLEQRRSSCRGAIGSAKGWRSLLNQLSEEERKDFEVEHIKEIAEVIGAYKDVGSTIPRMESVESSREQRPRATQESSCLQDVGKEREQDAEALPKGVWFNTEVLIAVGEK